MKSVEINFFFTNGTVTTTDINADEANDAFENICEQMRRSETGTIVLNNAEKKTLINLGNVDRVEIKK